MNWIEENSRILVDALNADNYPRMDAIQAIPTSIVREKVGELEERIEELETSEQQLLNMVGQMSDEIVTREREVEELRKTQCNWKESTKALMVAYGDNPADFPYDKAELGRPQQPKQIAKPLGWWYHKVLCEFGYWVCDVSNTTAGRIWGMRIYHNHLNKMVSKYKINLYGQKIEL